MDSVFFLFMIALIFAIVLAKWLTASLVKRWLAHMADSKKPLVILFGVPSPFLTKFLKFRQFHSFLTSNMRWIKLAVPVIDTPGNVILKPVSSDGSILESPGEANSFETQIKTGSKSINLEPDEESHKSYAEPIKDIPFLRSGWVWKFPPRAFWLTCLEVLLIALWVLWVGRYQINLDTTQVPIGREYPLQIQSNFVWQLLPECGSCMLWNGTMNGGAPSFVEVQGAVLHPAVILTTLLFGAVNGSKILLLFALFIAGLAIWWLARILELGIVPRMWAAALAVVGGNLAGKMDNGNIIILFSIASAYLILSPLLELVLKRRRRAIIWLGITLALAWLSGQGYLQIAILIGILPPYIVIFLTSFRNSNAAYKDFLLGMGLSVLLVGIFLVPLLHFSPYMFKDTDFELKSLQTIAYAPLNLVISNVDFFRKEALGLTGQAYVFTNYIGWVPILFSLAALRFVTRDKIRILIFFLITIVWLYAISTANLVQPLLKIIPWISNIRNPPLFQGLAVPLILGLAAWGLDLIIKKTWPRIGLLLTSGKNISISIKWIVLAVPLFFGIAQVYQFSQFYLKPVQTKISTAVVQALETSSSQWVGLPYSENFWTLRIFDRDMKIACVARPWFFKDHRCPPPYIEATRIQEDINKPGFENIVDKMNIVRYPEQEYASVLTDNGAVPCKANALGGNIDVVCNSENGGILMVKENYFSGWNAWVDGVARPVFDSQQLSMKAEPGSHIYQFRYQPWDVWVGLAVTLLGVILAAWIGFFYRQPHKNNP